MPSLLSMIRLTMSWVENVDDIAEPGNLREYSYEAVVVSAGYLDLGEYAVHQTVGFSLAAR